MAGKSKLAYNFGQDEHCIAGEQFLDLFLIRTLAEGMKKKNRVKGHSFSLASNGVQKSVQIPIRQEDKDADLSTRG